jgi:hypothetical protein
MLMNLMEAAPLPIRNFFLSPSGFDGSIENIAEQCPEVFISGKQHELRLTNTNRIKYSRMMDFKHDDDESEDKFFHRMAYEIVDDDADSSIPWDYRGALTVNDAREYADEKTKSLWQSSIVINGNHLDKLTRRQLVRFFKCDFLAHRDNIFADDMEIRDATGLDVPSDLRTNEEFGAMYAADRLKPENERHKGWIRYDEALHPEKRYHRLSASFLHLAQQFFTAGDNEDMARYYEERQSDVRDGLKTYILDAQEKDSFYEQFFTPSSLPRSADEERELAFAAGELNDLLKSYTEDIRKRCEHGDMSRFRIVDYWKQKWLEKSDTTIRNLAAVVSWFGRILAPGMLLGPGESSLEFQRLYLKEESNPVTDFYSWYESVFGTFCPKLSASETVVPREPLKVSGIRGTDRVTRLQMLFAPVENFLVLLRSVIALRSLSHRSLPEREVLDDHFGFVVGKLRNLLGTSSKSSYSSFNPTFLSEHLQNFLYTDFMYHRFERWPQILAAYYIRKSDSFLKFRDVLREADVMPKELLQLTTEYAFNNNNSNASTSSAGDHIDFDFKQTMHPDDDFNNAMHRPEFEYGVQWADAQAFFDPEKKKRRVNSPQIEPSPSLPSDPSHHPALRAYARKQWGKDSPLVDPEWLQLLRENLLDIPEDLWNTMLQEAKLPPKVLVPQPRLMSQDVEWRRSRPFARFVLGEDSYFNEDWEKLFRERVVSMPASEKVNLQNRMYLVKGISVAEQNAIAKLDAAYISRDTVWRDEMIREGRNVVKVETDYQWMHFYVAETSKNTHFRSSSSSSSAEDLQTMNRQQREHAQISQSLWEGMYRRMVLRAASASELRRLATAPSFKREVENRLYSNFYLSESKKGNLPLKLKTFIESNPSAMPNSPLPDDDILEAYSRYYPWRMDVIERRAEDETNVPKTDDQWNLAVHSFSEQEWFDYMKEEYPYLSHEMKVRLSNNLERLLNTRYEKRSVKNEVAVNNELVRQLDRALDAHKEKDLAKPIRDVSDSMSSYRVPNARNDDHLLYDRYTKHEYEALHQKAREGDAALSLENSKRLRRYKENLQRSQRWQRAQSAKRSKKEHSTAEAPPKADIEIEGMASSFSKLMRKKR